jgi:hypothetical protein
LDRIPSEAVLIPSSRCPQSLDEDHHRAPTVSKCDSCKDALAQVYETRNAYKIVVGEIQAKYHLGDIGRDGRIMFT